MRWLYLQKAFNLAERAEGQGPEERSSFLEEECDGDTLLWETVSCLLDAPEMPPEFMEEPAFKAIPDFQRFSFPCPPLFFLPEILNGTRILDLLGKGAMGTVYRVRQTGEPYGDYSLKIMNAELNGALKEEAQARFEEEQAILSRLDHPNIPKIHRVGKYKDRPFYVMELAPGVAINQFLKMRDHDLDSCLNLFFQLCAAVTHAHRRGIVHRDIKPSNILVFVLDGKPIVKLIDWGIAKQIGERRALSLELHTKFGQVVGTPAYMAPEALQGGVSHPSGDIYSLGAVLYEIVAGARFTPEELSGIRGQELYKYLKEKTLRPLGEGVLLKGAPKLAKYKIRALEAIVAKAMSQDAAKRHVSAERLVADLEKLRGGQPISLVQSPWLFKARRLAASRGAAFLLGFLAIATPVSVLYQSRLEKSRAFSISVENAQAREALHRKRSAALIHLSESLIISPREKNDPESLLADLNRLAYEIEKDFAEYPEDHVTLIHALASAYANAGETAQAETRLNHALSISRAQLGTRHIKTFESLGKLARFSYSQGEYDIAEKRYNDLFANYADLASSPVYLIARRGYARVMRMRGEHARALEIVKQVLDEQRRLLGTADFETLVTYQMLGDLHRALRQPDKAAAIYESVWETRAKAFGSEDPDTLLAWENLGLVKIDQNRLDEAASVFRQTSEVRARTQGKLHKHTLRSRGYLGLTLHLQGKNAEAVALLLPLKDEMERRFKPNWPELQRAVHTLGMALFELGEQEQGVALLADLADRQEAHLGFDHFKTLRTKHNLADLLKRCGRFQEAEDIQRQLVTVQQDRFGSSHPQTLEARLALAQLLAEQAKWTDLLAQWQLLDAGLQESPDEALGGKARLLAAAAHLHRGDKASAAAAFQTGFRLLEKKPGGLDLISRALSDYRSIDPESARAWEAKLADPSNH